MICGTFPNVCQARFRSYKISQSPKSSDLAHIIIMYTYEAVKAALLSRPAGVPAQNRKPTRRCHSQREKKGLYHHHNQFICPRNMEELDYIRPIEVSQDESLQTYLTSLGEGGRDYTLKTTTYWENMRRMDHEMCDRLKFLYHQS